MCQDLCQCMARFQCTIVFDQCEILDFELNMACILWATTLVLFHQPFG